MTVEQAETALDNMGEYGEHYSNFDHAIPENAEDVLRSGEWCITHPAWDHHGRMFFQDGLFHEVVKRYGSVVGVVSGTTLEDVFNSVNEKYGSN